MGVSSYLLENEVSDMKTKIIFFGTSDFAVPALKSLTEAGFQISAVITQPDKPTGRKGQLTPLPVKTAAFKLDLKILQPEKLKNNQKLVSCLLSLKPDMGIVASYGKIIPKELLDLPKYGMLNIHPSLLPKYRGPSPLQTAIINGDSETGVTIMKLDEELDHGAIILNIKYGELGTKNYKDAEKELAELGAKLLIETLPKYISGELTPKEQNHAQATFTKKIVRNDGQIYWNRSAEEIYNQIRALNPEPGTWTTWKNKVLNIKEVQYLEVRPQGGKEVKPRELICPTSQFEQCGITAKVNGNIAVQTKTSYLVLKKIQLEGGKEMDAKSFINGHPDFIGSKLE